MTRDQCLRLLHRQRIGRLSITDRQMLAHVGVVVLKRLFDDDLFLGSIPRLRAKKEG